MRRNMNLHQTNRCINFSLSYLCYVIRFKLNEEQSISTSTGCQKLIMDTYLFNVLALKNREKRFTGFGNNLLYTLASIYTNYTLYYYRKLKRLDVQKILLSIFVLM